MSEKRNERKEENEGIYLHLKEKTLDFQHPEEILCTSVKMSLYVKGGGGGGSKICHQATNKCVCGRILGNHADI